MSHESRRRAARAAVLAALFCAPWTPLAARAQAPAAPPPIEELALTGTAPPAGDTAPTVERFKAALTPHGRWVETPEYGVAWIPAGVAPTWRPYGHGRWTYTEHGWTFVSFDPWGWAPFHYGRWVYYPPHGWAWVPGSQWAPAWVAWRYGRGYVAWAPLGPSAVTAPYYATPSLWIAVRGRNFYQPLNPRAFVRTTFVHRVLRSTYFAGLPRAGVYHTPPLQYVAGLVGRPIQQIAATRVTPHWVSGGKFIVGKRLKEAFKQGRMVARPTQRVRVKTPRRGRVRRVYRRGTR